MYSDNCKDDIERKKEWSNVFCLKSPYAKLHPLNILPRFTDFSIESQLKIHY